MGTISSRLGLVDNQASGKSRDNANIRQWRSARVTGNDWFSEAVRYYANSGLDRNKVLDKPLPLYAARQRATEELRKTLREVSLDQLEESGTILKESGGEFTAGQMPELTLQFQDLVSQLLELVSDDLVFRKILYALIRQVGCEHVLSPGQLEESHELLGDADSESWSQIANVCGYRTFHNGATASGNFYHKKDRFLEKIREGISRIL